MTYKVLAVYMDLEQPNDTRLEVAAELARRFDAAVIGIAAADPTPVYGSPVVPVGMVVLDDTQVRDQMAAAEARFRDHLRGVTMEWRAALAPPAAFVAQQCRAADLLITGAVGDTLTDPRWQLDPSDVVMQVGRPLLTVPLKLRPFSGKRMIMAWKDTREARRAIRDALPLARQAEKAFVATVIEADEERAVMDAQVADVAAWLARHGVPAEPRSLVATSSNAADQLDSLAVEEGVDLTVAGAYGHSRLRQWILGGVTRQLLASTTRCSLLAH